MKLPIFSKKQLRPLHQLKQNRFNWKWSWWIGMTNKGDFVAKTVNGED